jgi:hypothetical protein
MMALSAKVDNDGIIEKFRRFVICGKSNKSMRWTQREIKEHTKGEKKEDNFYSSFLRCGRLNNVGISHHWIFCLVGYSFCFCMGSSHDLQCQRNDTKTEQKETGMRRLIFAILSVA